MPTLCTLKVTIAFCVLDIAVLLVTFRRLQVSIECAKYCGVQAKLPLQKYVQWLMP